MKNGVGVITNCFQGKTSNRTPISGEGVFEYNEALKKFSFEGLLDFHNGFKDLVGEISFKIADIVKGNNHDFLIFSRGLELKDLNSNNVKIKQNFGYVWYLKSKTSLTKEEELFLRQYQISSSNFKVEYFDKYKLIQEKIEKSIREENERIKTILNQTKGLGEKIEFF